ncbi:alpha-mannosidase II-like protein [Leptotrombidium deliense]|uniref:Alpha-mannosidase II-like protein n=1 Tax=Leptotrombidium deliense TaxID=299467 RepID=A0A443RT49_9ACAR|nr:alpha-mannosidase II-like protein [Leptotrombidium deliense]
MAFLLKRMGFKAMVIQRVHYSMKKYLARRKLFEFNWMQMWENNHDNKILSHMLPFHSYDIPRSCGPDPTTSCTNNGC